MRAFQRMSRSLPVWPWVCLAVVAGGCDAQRASSPPPPAPSREVARPPPPPPPPPAPSSQSPPTTVVQQPARAPSPPPAAAPSTRPARAQPQYQQLPSRPTITTDQPPIGLSAGVALPQTGPTGTMMSFSVDYRFIRGEPHSSPRYIWVIERANGEPLGHIARLATKGTLQTFILQWRPEQGPFRTHIEEMSADGSTRRVSRSVPLH